MKIEPTNDGQLSAAAKHALVFYELTRRKELHRDSLRPTASTAFPILSDNTAHWVENQQARGKSDWTWFASALKFLDGYGQEGSDFEEIKMKVMAHLEMETARFNHAEAERNALITAAQFQRKNERNKLIGGLGGIHTDSHASGSYWDTVDPGHWREQE